MKDELISIIIPVYNVEKYLARCLDSIVNQSYKNLEIILVDDGSKDSSPKICDDYAKADTRIKVIHKDNEGVSVARNTGIKYSTGKYISFIDSDDWIETNLYEIVIKCLYDNNADIVKFQYLIENNGETKNTGCNYNFTGFVEKNKIIDLLLSSKIQGECWSYIFKKELLAQDELFKGGIIYGEDLLFSTEIILRTRRFYFIEDKLYHYFQNNSDSVTKNINKVVEIIKNICLLYNDLINVFKKYNEYNDSINTKIATNLFLKFCFHINKIYKANKQDEIYEYLLNNDELHDIVKNVDTTKLKRSYRLFRVLILYRCKYALRLYGFAKNMATRIN